MSGASLSIILFAFATSPASVMLLGFSLALFAIATFTHLDVLTAPAAARPGPASAPAGRIPVRATPATRLAVSVRKFRGTDHELERHRHADDVDALRQ
jgi:hypothetical protein